MWRRGHAGTGRAHCISAQSSYRSMASPPRILVEVLRRSLPTKDHIKRFLRRWTSLLAFLVRKLGKWRFLRGSKLGTIRSSKPPESSLPSDKAGSSSVSGGSVCTGGIDGYVVSACTVPASANQPPGCERAERPEPQSDTTPTTSTLATIPVDLPEALVGPSTINQTVESSHDNHSSGNLSVQSRSSDRLSTSSTSRASLRALVQNDQPPQDLRVTYGQLGPGLGASQLIDRSSRSPSPQPSLNTAQSDNLDTTPTGLNSSARAGRVIYMTFGLQGLTDLPPSFSDTQERHRQPAIRQKQRTTCIGLNIQNPSTESLPTISINPQEIMEEPMPIDTSAHLSLHTSPSDRAEAASQNSPTTSSTASVFALPEGRILRLINSDEIPRYTKNNTMQVDHHIIATRPLDMLADLVRENCCLWNP